MVPIIVGVSPNPVVETVNSEVYAVVQVRADPKYAGMWVLIDSSELANSCGAVWYRYHPSAINTVDVVGRNKMSTFVDQDGNATVEVAADNCVPGAATLTAQLEASSTPNGISPLPNASTTLNVVPPGTSSPSSAIPSSEVETGNKRRRVRSL